MLLAEGYSDQWNFNRVGQGYGYVRCKNGKVKGGLSTVARLDSWHRAKTSSPLPRW